MLASNGAAGNAGELLQCMEYIEASVRKQAVSGLCS